MSEPRAPLAAGPAGPARAVGGGRRPLLALQVLVACVLAFGAAALAIDLAESSFVRVDLSASGRNTLDPEVGAIVAGLSEPARVDVFFRPLAAPYDRVSLEAQSRMLELLFTAANAYRDRLEVTVWDERSLQRMRARQEELGVEGTNLLVVSCGERRSSVPLFGGLASVDWGNPTPRGARYLIEQGIGGAVDPSSYDPSRLEPPRLVSFRGQEALAEALLKVAAGTRPKVLFTSGHGEADPFGSLSTDVGRFRRALERDGFEVGAWDGSAGGGLPADCELLFALGLEQPLRASEREAIERYVARGGRLIAAPSYREVEEGLEGATASLLFRYGMIAEPGVVCEPVNDALGRALEGLPECARLVVLGSELSPSHPLTRTLRQRGLRVEFVLAHAFRRGGLGPGGLLLDLIHSDERSWRDLAGTAGQPDFRFDPAGEKRGRERLVMLAELAPAVAEDQAAEPDPGARAAQRGRVLGVSAATFFADGSFDTNRDFLLAAANWMVEREELVRVRPRSLGGNVLDLRQGRSRPVLSALALFVLPGALGLGGLLIAWRRRR